MHTAFKVDDVVALTNHPNKWLRNCLGVVFAVNSSINPELIVVKLDPYEYQSVWSISCFVTDVVKVTDPEILAMRALAK